MTVIEEQTPTIMIIIITRSYWKMYKLSYFAESLHSEINEIEEIGFREEHYSEVISHLIIERMGRFPCEGETLKF